VLANMAAVAVSKASNDPCSQGIVVCAETVRRYGPALSNRIDAVSL
jgi:hypothetical protein